MRDDQVQLRDALLGRLSAAPRDGAWQALVDAGVAGFRILESLGGLALSAAEAEPVMDALGDLCLGAPFLETSVIAAGLLQHAGSPASHSVLREIAAGDAIVAVGGVEEGLAPADVTAVREGGAWMLRGDLRVVIDAPSAQYLLVPARSGDQIAIFIVGAQTPGLAFRPVPTIDGRMAADISLAGVFAPETMKFNPPSHVSARVLDEATAAICIEAAALMRRLVRDTVAYAKTREQFGQAIGTFQVVQHRLVDMQIETRRAAAISRRAIAALDAPHAERARAISAAKVTVAKAGRFVGQNAVQLHGGMGMTEELGVGRYFKRLTVIEAQLGGVNRHLRRFMEQGG